MSGGAIQQAFAQTRKEIELLDRHLTAIRLKMVDMKVVLDKLVGIQAAAQNISAKDFTDAAFTEMIARVQASKKEGSTAPNVDTPNV